MQESGLEGVSMRVRIVILLISLLFSSCGKAKKIDKLIEVTTYTVEAQTIPADFELVGVCQSSHQVEIWSRVEGYLKKVAYTEGSFVKEGDALFEIDPREFESNVAAAEANLEKEKANLWSAQKSVERYLPLYQQKAASRKDWEDASAQLLAQQATVNSFQAKLDEAKLNLGYTKISSPISGLTTSSKYQEGTLINPGVNGLLTTVSAIDPMWVVVNVSDYYFLLSSQEIARGELVIPDNFRFDIIITLADGSQYPLPGKVSFISPVLDPNTGTLSARAIFPNPESLLKPGQFVRARVTGGKRPNTIIVPQASVMQGKGGKFVYVVTKQGIVEIREVKTGDWYENFWIIKSGLKNGDEVVQSGVNKISEGIKVKVLNKAKNQKRR